MGLSIAVKWGFYILRFELDASGDCRIFTVQTLPLSPMYWRRIFHLGRERAPSHDTVRTDNHPWLTSYMTI